MTSKSPRPADFNLVAPLFSIENPPITADDSLSPQIGEEKSFRKAKFESNRTSRHVQKFRDERSQKGKAGIAVPATQPKLKSTVQEKRARSDKAKALQKNVRKDFKSKVELNHQFGFEALAFRQDLPVAAMNIVENFTALYIALSHCNNSSAGAATLFLWFKAHCPASKINSIYTYLSEDCGIDLTAFTSLTSQAGLEDLAHDDTVGKTQDWLSSAQEVFSNWKHARESVGFSKVSKLISLTAALGLCSLSSFNWDFAGIRLFSIPAMKKHVSAGDCVTALFDTVLYFVQGGYECLKKGNLDAFLFQDNDARQFDETFFGIIEKAGHVRSGNLEKLCGISENDYSYLLDVTIDTAQQMYNDCTGTWEKQVLYTRMIQLRKARSDFQAYRTDGSLRMAPFTLFIEGPSGVGKSSLSQLVMRTVLHRNGFDAADDKLVVVKDSDKFLSNYRSYINGIFIDDVGNTKPDFVEKAPTQQIIELCNNIPQYANMAEVDMKGKVSIEPMCIVMTSNKALLDIANTYSYDSLSIARRAHLHLYIRMKDEFKQEGTNMLDSRKVREAFGDSPEPDIWEITGKVAITSTGTKVNYRDRKSVV